MSDLRLEFPDVVKYSRSVHLDQWYLMKSFLDGGTYGVGETEFYTSPELMYLGLIKEGAGPELICIGVMTRPFQELNYSVVVRMIMLSFLIGLGDERSMTEVSVKEQMKKLVR
ncbi:hypothetical protein Tco_1212870 [Tanacetum coccineum]